jgi:hypothetical protein
MTGNQSDAFVIDLLLLFRSLPFKKLIVVAQENPRITVLGELMMIDYTAAI